MNVSSILSKAAPWLLGLAVLRALTPPHRITDADRKDVKILHIHHTNWILFDRLRIEYQPNTLNGEPTNLYEEPRTETTYSFLRLDIESRVFKNLDL